MNTVAAVAVAVTITTTATSNAYQNQSKTDRNNLVKIEENRKGPHL